MDTAYERANRISKSMGEYNDCTVKALAIVTGRPYEECHKILAANGRRKGRGFRLSTNLHILEKMGYVVKKAEVSGQTNGHKWTVKSIPNKLKYGRYLVFTSGHALAIVNGEVCDWSKDTKRRIKSAYEIIDATQYNKPVVFTIPKI